MNEEEKFMRLSLELALKGKTSPNPKVGAVVVKDGKVVGCGYHRKAGGRHAEIFALNQAKGKAKGGSLYVSLEPCSIFGRTPPCVEKIISSGITEVIVGMKDPNPLNNGKGIERLRASGIKVKVGILRKDSAKINEVFTKYITKGMPFVTVKIAQSLDGKIATKVGDSRWITANSARRYVHKLRREADAILVGVNTIIKDNPLLTTRLRYTKNISAERQPIKIIVDSQLKTPPQAQIFSQRSPAKVIIATTKSAPQKKIKALNKYAEVVIFGDKNKRVNLRSLMRNLAAREITNIFVEGGGELIASLLKEKLVDKVLFFIAPKIIGGRDALTSVEGEGIAKVSQAIRLKGIEITRFGEDILLEGYPLY
jgi:diaminohydroxyphosphoribosylaminopyrimidine deaminase/5-amino-6-(5-phosphoribosylamino)uracil reductase